MKNLIILLVVLLYTTVSFADICPRTKIEKGVVAPCTGYILSLEAIEEAAKLPKEISLLNDKLKLKDDDLNIKDQKIKLLTDFVEKKDVTINSLHESFLKKDQNESLKLGLAIGLSAVGTALVCIGVAFAISGAVKIELKQ